MYKRQENKEWASRIYIPPDKSHNLNFVVPIRSAVLNGVVDQYRAAYQALGLFSPNQCEPDSFEKLDYEGKVLVLSPDTLKESCWKPENQLWYAHDGFGCSPTAIGRSIRCTCLNDEEMARWNRTDFTGVLKEEFLPDWAREKLQELKLNKLQQMSRSEKEQALAMRINLASVSYTHLLRIDFGSGGKSFWSTWWPHNSDQFNTPEFKRELQQIVDTLRRNGPLQSLSAMSSYCWTHGGEISTNDRVYEMCIRDRLRAKPNRCKYFAGKI